MYMLTKSALSGHTYTMLEYRLLASHDIMSTTLWLFTYIFAVLIDTHTYRYLPVLLDH